MTPWTTLDAWDFAPFRALSDMPMAMTAHVVFDGHRPQAPGHHLAQGGPATRDPRGDSASTA